MNCPSRADPIFTEGWNQNPNALNADTTTRADLEYVANARLQQDHRIDAANARTIKVERNEDTAPSIPHPTTSPRPAGSQAGDAGERPLHSLVSGPFHCFCNKANQQRGRYWSLAKKAASVLRKYGKAVGPGFVIAVAYIDPGNYATDVAAGASFEYRLLFIVLMSNMFAIFLQSLCIKLGSVTGMNLAENIRTHLPPWLNYLLYFFAESAIIATDIAEVIGTAIALNLLLHIPLVAGCAISIIDVLVILIFYRPQGSVHALRAFEMFVILLVLGVVVCFCYELSKISSSVGRVFHGYLPSSTLGKPQALYQACGILGATVMPHSLFLGSGIVQPRLREFDEKNHTAEQPDAGSLNEEDRYRPSLAAIRSCMPYSIAELAVSLFTFALFVNSSILIVAGASLYRLPEADDADLFSIHSLLSHSIAPVAGTMFALALLLSGTSAGIVCTIAGQMVSEGQLNWTLKPWVRRLITRSISITPSIIIAGAVGRKGLSAALQGSQIALSVILPFVSAPLIWFTCRAHYMKVPVRNEDVSEGTEAEQGACVQMRNGWITTVLALVIWVIIVIMNLALLVLVGLGVA